MRFKTQPIFTQPADYPMAHCATLAELPNGDLIAAWFGGSYETAPDQILLTARYDLRRECWSKPQPLAVMEGKALGQPVFWVRQDGELWLFFDAIQERDWRSALPFLQRSADEGCTWSAPQLLFDYPGLMFRSRLCLLPGRAIIPAYDENRWESLMMISDDDGKSWRLTAPIVTPQGNIHPCPVHLEGGHLLAYLRTGGRGGVIWRTFSFDGGEHWETPEPTTLPNPNSGIDLLRLHSDRLLLAYNPSAERRTPLALAVASLREDWRPPRILEDEAYEFSYPTLLQTRTHDIHLVYTYRRRHIQHVSFDEAWLEEAT
ncbi:MAG: exo-alpha-sialidase [Caldilinea sp.]|nr:exo-alpha-sialidase [Caldilinea sp.]MDW8439349.1 sialidase family protein [Caldilineaceae bacterium]